MKSPSVEQVVPVVPVPSTNRFGPTLAQKKAERLRLSPTKTLGEITKEREAREARKVATGFTPVGPVTIPVPKNLMSIENIIRTSEERKAAEQKQRDENALLRASPENVLAQSDDGH
jgi:hypothetical protein